MKKLELLKSLIYILISTSKDIKAKSIGTHENTILVTIGRELFEITIEKVS